MQSELIEKKKEAENIYSFFFVKPLQLVYDPGDFVELSFDYPGGGGGRRWFTVASAPHEKYLQITMKYPPQPSQFKKQLDKLKPGDEVFFSPALGNFNLPRDESEKLVFIAGGVGITPVRSIVSHLLNTKDKRKLEIFYVAKQNEVIFTDLLDNYPVKYESSSFDPLSVNLEDKTVFLSGPEPLIKKYYETLLASGISKSRIKLDYFPGYTDI